MKDTQLVDLFQKARKDNSLAVIEGVQAIKHAVRFKAAIKEVLTCDIKFLENLLDELAPDVKTEILSQAKEVSEETFQKLSPQPPRTKAIALADRRIYKLTELEDAKPIVFLEDPRDLENIGAVIRVAAAADAAAVCVSGPADIWHPAIIRGGAGLHYALPVLNITTEEVLALPRPKLALDPTGSEYFATSSASNTIYIFGTERHGISPTLLKKTDGILRLTMKQGVSSLNLATSVAATLYRKC